MSNIQIKDINELTASTNQSGGAEFATAMPDGIGGFNLRKVTKATILSYGADAIPTRADGGGGNFRVMNMKGTEIFMECIGASSLIGIRAAILGITVDSGGSISSPARFESDGTVRGQFFRIVSAGGQVATIINGATSTQSLSIIESGVIQANPKTVYAEPLTGGIINVDNVQHAAIAIVPAATIAALTINMPNAPTEGRRVSFYFAEDVTAITHSGTGATILSPLTTASAGDRVTYIYNEEEEVWFPMA